MKLNYAHFPKLQETKPTDAKIFVTGISELRAEFSTRFADIHSITSDLRLFGTLFDVEVGTVPQHVRMELIEMQCSDLLKSKFHAESVTLVDF